MSRVQQLRLQGRHWKQMQLVSSFRCLRQAHWVDSLLRGEKSVQINRIASIFRYDGEEEDFPVQTRDKSRPAQQPPQ